MARALLVAERPLAAGEGDRPSCEAKIATARFYAEHMLSRAPGAARRDRRRRRERHRAAARGVLSHLPPCCATTESLHAPASRPATLPLPIIGAPLFIISNPKLVIAQCKAGIVGSMPALNARPAEQLDEWLAEITETLAAWNRAHPERPAAPFAINQIVHKSNDRLEHDMEVCAKYKVPIVITSLGARADVNDAVHAWGGIVLHDIINNTFAQEGDREGRRRPDRGRGRRRRPCRRQEPVRADRRRSASGSTARSRCRARSPPAARCSPRRRWAPTSPTSARPSSPPRRPAPPTAYKQMIVESTQRRHRLLQPVHRRARQLPEAARSARRPRPGQPARERPEQDELRRRRREARPGRTSGAAARASARSRRWCRPAC